MPRKTATIDKPANSLPVIHEVHISNELLEETKLKITTLKVWFRRYIGDNFTCILNGDQGYIFQSNDLMMAVRAEIMLSDIQLRGWVVRSNYIIDPTLAMGYLPPREK